MCHPEHMLRTGVKCDQYPPLPTLKPRFASGRTPPPWSRIRVDGRCPEIGGMVKPAEGAIVRLAQRTARSFFGIFGEVRAGSQREP